MTPKYRAYFLSCGIHDPYTIAQLLATCSLRYLRMIHYGFDLMHVCYLCLLHFVAIQTFQLCRLNLISEVIKKSIFDNGSMSRLSVEIINFENVWKISNAQLYVTWQLQAIKSFHLSFIFIEWGFIFTSIPLFLSAWWYICPLYYCPW